MSTVPFVPVHRGQLEKEIQKAIRKVGKEVVHVRYSLGEDWTGDPSIFFRVLLTDEASRPGQLAAVDRRISTRVLEALRPQENWGLLAYFSYRSEAEQTQFSDPDWD